ncbi:MAG TPA: DUF4136 domain-containing protein [Myxococcales bacterium]|nr:DUF4136 domain-containing protein [Myxococcales bacterium]
MTRSLGLLAAAAALAACSTVKVQTEYDKAANFKAYQTYAYVSQQPGPEQAAAARDPKIREAALATVDKALAAKGLRKTGPDQSPDLLVAVHGSSKKSIEVQTYGYSYSTHPYGYYPALSTPSTEAEGSRDGTLIIDLIDAATKQMIWRGTATDTFKEGTEVKTVTNAVEKTLADYPPPGP